MRAGGVGLKLEGPLAVVTLDFPPLNALDLEARLELGEVFAGLERRLDRVRVVILRGAQGCSFSAGADLAQLLELTPSGALDYILASQRVYARIAAFPRPVIAAIEGYSLGGGLELALYCDLRYADPNARLGFPEARFSLFPGNGGLRRALRYAPLSAVKELAYSGRIIEAARAERLGLVDRVTAPGKVMKEARETAARIAAQGPAGVAAAKQILEGEADILALLEQDRRRWARLVCAPEAKEAMRVFLARRRRAAAS